MEKLLSQVTDGSLEKQTSENTLMHFGHYHEKRFSDIHEATLNKMIAEVAGQVNEEEPEEDRRRTEDIEFEPKQKIADIFYMRFFQGKTYEEIGKKYGIDHRTAAGAYSQAVKRVNAILETLDGRDKAMQFCVNRNRNSLTKHEKAFLLNKVFGFAFREIAEVLGYAGPDAIQHKVNEMYQGYRKEYFPEKKKPLRSVYDGLSNEQAMERIAY